jgi:hypothetical protein
VLPGSFTGGMRYYVQHYQDAMAICRVHGGPDTFTTFTCNSNKQLVHLSIYHLLVFFSFQYCSCLCAEKEPCHVRI